MRHVVPILCLAAASVAGCGDNQATRPVDVAQVVDAGPDLRGPATFTLTGGANSLLWDAATSTLYLTSNEPGTLYTWTDQRKLENAGNFPAVSGAQSLGDLVKRSDGTVLAASFGFGTQGTLFAIPPSGGSVAFTGLPPTRRRIGMAQDAAGALYTSYFVGGGNMAQVGGVARVELTGTTATETEIAGESTSAGFKKLVGLVATPSAVFASDQTDKKIYRIAIPGFVVTTVATVPSADLLAILPNGDLLTGGNGIHRITQSGTVTTLPIDGVEQIRGIAYDPMQRRLFFIEHSLTVGNPDKLHVRPYDG